MNLPFLYFWIDCTEDQLVKYKKKTFRALFSNNIACPVLNSWNLFTQLMNENGQ